MTAPFFLPASEEADLIVSRWQRQSEELLLQRIYGAPEAGEEIEEDDSTSLPPLPPLDDEYADGGED